MPVRPPPLSTPSQPRWRRIRSPSGLAIGCGAVRPWEPVAVTEIWDTESGRKMAELSAADA